MSVRSTGGFTMIELMVAFVVSGIVIGTTLTIGTTVEISYGTHRRMIQVERSARVALELLADAARSASPGVPLGNVGDAVGCTTFGALRVTQGVNAPDSLEIVYGLGGAITSLRSSYDSGSTSMTVTDGTGLAVGDQVVVTNLAQGTIVTVTSVNLSGGVWTLGTQASSAVCPSIVFPTGGYAVGSFVIRARIAKFYIDGAADVGTVPTLMMDPDDAGPLPGSPLADGIEDLQVAVGVDVDGDGSVNDAGTTSDEVFGNAAGDAAPPAVTTTIWRSLRVSLVALNPEDTNVQPTYHRPALEDHTVGAADRWRRRALSTTIEIRNLKGSP